MRVQVFHLRNSPYTQVIGPGKGAGRTIGTLRARERPNQGLDLTNPDAAQSVASAPLCLLSGLAAQAHVGLVERA